MTKISDIKRAQKASLLFKTISQLYSRASYDNKDLLGVYITRVEVSTDKSVCYVYFYTPDGPEVFKEKLHLLKLYKPSLRSAVAKEIASRYTPEIFFKFDEKQEKINRIDTLLEKVKNDLHE